MQGIEPVVVCKEDFGEIFPDSTTVLFPKEPTAPTSLLDTAATITDHRTVYSVPTKRLFTTQRVA
jgi:hypothetical protein